MPHRTRRSPTLSRSSGSSRASAPPSLRDDRPAPGASASAVRPLLEAVLSELAEDALRPAKRDLALKLTAICRGSTEMPVFPAAARELDRLLRGSRPKIQEILAVVRTDPELVRRIMTLASSAVFSHGASDVDEAVVRIGLERLWRVAMQSLVSATMFRVGDLQPTADAIREESLRVAELASRLAPSRLTGEAYLGGLLHQVGALSIFRFVPRSVDEPMARFVDRVRRECQCAIGVLVASHWGMPSAVVEAIADHNKSEPASEVGKLVRAARIAIAARGDELPETMTALAALGVDARAALEIAVSICV